jgi:hypothetical protein
MMIQYLAVCSLWFGVADSFHELKVIGSIQKLESLTLRAVPPKVRILCNALKKSIGYNADLELSADSSGWQIAHMGIDIRS